MRRLRRLVTGSGRWVRPDRLSVTALAAVVVLAAGGAWGFWAWATRSASPARTLALAASVHRDGLALDSALEVTWTWSVGGTAALEDRWHGLVAPSLPPGLCPAASGEGGPGTGDGALERALGRLDAAVERGSSREELETRIADVRETADVGVGGRRAFLTRYGLARGYAAAGDHATAADVLQPVFEGYLAPENVPDTDRADARRRVERGQVGRTLAVDAFHGRYLAGTLAHHRGEPEEAVAWFRRSINAVYYLLALEPGGALSADGHYQRIAADPGPSSCGGTREPLTSLDAYAGLVASYMADTDFRDPAGLPREVVRQRFQMDRTDPFAPVLAHSARTGGDPEATPVPENLLWAASNLQRVYHHNRLRPDPRLEVTRAVLLLHLTNDSTWEAALGEDGLETCTTLEALAGDLHGDAAAVRLGRRTEPGAADSARAAVAVQTFARLDRECPGTEVPPVEAPVRSAWIRLGGGYLTRGLGSRYEGVRAELVSVMAGGAQPLPVLEDRLGPPVERVRSHLRDLRRGRIPPELPAGLPVDPVRRYAEEWWEAVFTDVAEALAGQPRGAGDGAGDGPADGAADGGVGRGGAGIRAGEVAGYLTALESAVDHAGLRPADVYDAEELAPLAGAAGGWSGTAAWRVRTLVRNHPWASAALLALGVGAVSLLALLAHVSWWRYRLLTSQRFYAEEWRARSRRAPGGRAAA